MKKKYDLTKPNRAKKHQRMEAKKGLPSFYTKVVRVPLEKGLKAYTQIVSQAKAIVLVHGRFNGFEFIKGSRTFNYAR